MTSNQAIAIYKVAEFLDRNHIQLPESKSTFGWATRLIRYFCDVPAAQSVTYPVTIWLEGMAHEGFLEVNRDGQKVIRLAA